MYSTVYYVLRKISTPLVTRKCMCPLTVGLDPGTLLARTYISAYIVCIFVIAHVCASLTLTRASVRLLTPGGSSLGAEGVSQGPRVPESPRGEKVFTAGTLRGPTWHLGAT